MFHVEILVGECSAVNRLAAFSIAVSDVTTLNHEVFDDPVKRGAFVMEWLAGDFGDSLVAVAKGAEVLARSRSHVAEQLEDHPTRGSFFAFLKDVEEASRPNKSLGRRSEWRDG